MHRKALLVVLAAQTLSSAAFAASAPETWRAQTRLIDLHHHVSYNTQHLQRAIGIMNQAGIGIGVNLSGGTVTHQPGEKSAFEQNKAFADTLHPGRFLHYMNLDYAGWDQPDFSDRAVKQIEEGHRLGAAGLKEYKRLGLYLRDGQKKLIRIDDPKLDPVWKRCGELNMPISIHVADPKAFWLPYDETNERWTELKDHRSWWFGDPKVYPSRAELLEARNRVVARHPNTTFVCVHFANNPEDIDAVGQWLDQYPNMLADISARVPELGRHDPDKVHKLFVKHQDRILFGTDFMVYDHLILGSGGSGPPPTDADAASFYEKHWRWLETRDRNFEHMTPIQGEWTISGIGLPADVLRKIYFDNARKLLARSIPQPRAKAGRIEQDFPLDGDLSKTAWTKAAPITLEQQSTDGQSKPALATTVRSLWSGHYLYLSYSCPYTTLTLFEPTQPGERFGLWERDVVEAFIGVNHDNINDYLEFEVAPTGEKLDVAINPPKKDFDWDSRFECVTRIDREKQLWTAEVRIPMASITRSNPESGTRWRLNLYRCDYANNAFLAWNPTLRRTFHAPDRFGILELE